MFGLDPIEIIIIGAFALFAIGPDDLPRAMKTVTRWIRAVRKMAREFQGHIDDIVLKAELDELREQVRKATLPTLDSLLASDSVPHRALPPPEAHASMDSVPVAITAETEPVAPETSPASHVA